MNKENHLSGADFELLRKIETSQSLAFFAVDRWKVLFRIDGLVITVSDVVFDLFSTYKDLELPERLQILAGSYGIDEVDSALQSLAALAATGILSQELPQLAPRNPEEVQPGGILLMITQTCNLACTYCYAGGGTYGSKTKFLSEDKAESAIDLMLARAPGRRSFTVTFFGGEPLLNFPMVKRVVEYCTRKSEQLAKSFSYSMTTNATVLSDEIIQFLKEHRFTLMVSYDGKEAQAANRPFKAGGDSHEIVTSNIRRMTDAGLPVQLRATLVKERVTRQDVHDLVQIGKSLNVRKVTMSPVSATKNALFPAHEDLVLDPKDHTRLAEIYRDISDENLTAACNGSTESVRFDPYLHLIKALATGKAVGMGRCGACFGMSAVSTEDKIYPCHRFVGMDDYAIGSLSTGIEEEKVEAFFAKAAQAGQEKCSTCWVRLLCTGGCFYHNADGKGGFSPPEDSACDGYRDAVKYAIGQLLRLRSLPREQAEQFMANTAPGR